MNEEEEYNHLADLTTENDGLRSKVNSLRADLAKAENAEREANYELEKSRQALKEEKDHLEELQAQIYRLEKDIEHEQAATKDAEGRVEVLYTDLDQKSFAHRSALDDRDNALADLKDKELQYEDLERQWQECEDRIAQLEAEKEDAQFAVNAAADAESDQARLREQIADLERTIMVKDERISHLEMQVQKERQRNYNNADAIARSLAASPVEEDDHYGAIGFDSLEAELSMVDDEESVYEPEPNDYSKISETLLTWSPIAPALQPPSKLHTQDAASISPRAPKVPLLTTDVRQAGSLEPREPAPVAPSSIDLNVGASTEPVAARVPTHEFSVPGTASTAPIEPVRASPSEISVNEGAVTEPVAARIPTHAFSVPETASTSPVEPARASPSQISVNEGAATAPVAARTPTHEFSVPGTASTEPIEPARTPLSSIYAHESASTVPVEPTRALPSSIYAQESASTSPIEPARASPSTISVHETASLAPQDPAPAPQSTLNQHEIANISPREPGPPTLAVDVKEAASTTPIVHQVLALTNQVIDHATVSTTPIEPIETPTASISTQTDAPVLASQLAGHATVSTTPVAPTNIPTICDVSDTSVIDISPIEPKTVQRKLITKGTQTTPHESPSIGVAPVLITHEVEPIEQVLPKPEPKRPTASAGVQTTMDTPVEEPEVIQAPPPVLVTTSNKFGGTEMMLLLLMTLLAVICVYFYAKVNAWEAANGVGLGGGYGNMASRSGAYGNGRHLFGILPVGMGVGDSWFSEQFARHMSSAVSRFEDWAGIAYEPHY
ncbi:hypothetical protein TW65_86030 [Stemphylium lycopersici]|uniref:Uncharacterized protein n=1 Tax=Stemphylium lycopersici TaxID=183478 RepID=A0A364NDK6_STELY|nr:hypothetical protein TW65_86030 [Stemphylium lycopersici]RAR15360.1 hypothetical protein DDE83_001189 [Stemphylium lycopersici]